MARETVGANGVKYWEDCNGILTPVKNIKEEDKARDKAVERAVNKALKLHDLIVKFKAEMEEIVKNYLESVAEKYDSEWQGNTILINFAQDMKVAVRVQKYIDFNEKINVAKTLINECLMAWSADSNPALATLVNQAFETDKKGQINREFIFKLTHFKMNAKTHMEEWNKAIALLNESMYIKKTKDYMNYYRRIDGEKWELITLDYAAVDPTEAVTQEA